MTDETGDAPGCELRRGVDPALIEWARDYDPDAPVPVPDPAYYPDTQQCFIDNVRYRHSFYGWASGARWSAPDNVEVRRMLS